MATSRYDTPSSSRSNTTGGILANGGTVNTNTNTSGQQGTTQQGVSQTDQSGTSTTNQKTSQTTNTQNMTGSSLAALNLLIQQLLGGGTQEMAQQQAQRQAEINNVTQSRAGYTKEAAFNDAQGLIAQTMQQTLQQLLPGINRAAAGAGTSQNSMRALLTQQAAEQAAQAGAAQGLTAAVNYGNINSSLSQVLQQLTQPNDAATTALLNALQIAKGAQISSTTTGNSTSTTNSDQTSQTQSQQQSNTNSNQNQNQTQVANVGKIGAGTGGTSSGNRNVDGLVYYGPQQSTLQVAQSAANASGTDLGTLLQLAGGSVADQFTF